MQIDPKIAMYLNIVALVLSVVAVAGWWDDLIGDHNAEIVTGMMLTVVSAINIVLHAYSSAAPGPAATLAPTTKAS